jgi:catechol 2,3-dioxygenase
MSDELLGAVALTVSDLGSSERFYRDVLGLSVLAREKQGLVLGPGGGAPLLELTELPGARRVPSRTTGLYHFAILVPTRVDLARALRRVVQARWPLSGSSDHLVSEALYLSDPDGNGIEIYRDRPRSEWSWRNGQIEMTLDPLDLDQLLAEAGNDEENQRGMPARTIMGHVHLRVSDLRSAGDFYHRVLGFDITNGLYPGALFLSIGGYHHHIGLNTWESKDAPPAPSDAVGLRNFALRLPGHTELDEVADRVRSSGLAIEDTSDGFLVRDPSRNGVRIIEG